MGSEGMPRNTWKCAECGRLIFSLKNPLSGGDLCEPCQDARELEWSRDEITRLREALEWYKDLTECLPDLDGDCSESSFEAHEELTADAGHRARVALAKREVKS